MTPFLLLLSAQAATVSPLSVPAATPSDATVSVETFGRYALTATSELGASLVLVDRMAGPMPPQGQPGVRDGRLDVFLDRGEYRLRLAGSEADPGSISLAITPSVELEAEPRALEDGATLSATLADHQQRSYWIHVTARERLQVEAAGRHLADLRLWQDGTWLHDAAPSCQTVEPSEGHPLRDCSLDVFLEPGLYQLTAYGGPGQDWADGGAASPFHLRRGVPDLGDIGQQARTISPFGVDRFRVNASYVHVALPEVATVRLSAWDGRRSPFSPSGQSATITEKSRHPVAALDLRQRQERIVVVQGTAGQPYTLQHFTPSGASSRLARHSEPSWVSTLAAGTAGDQLDVTALLLREGDTAEVIAASGIPLRDDVRYARTVNLPAQPVSLLLDVATEGTWRFELSGVDGRMQLAPLLIRPPSEREPPPLKRSPQEVTLSPGLHLLVLHPDEAGIAQIDIRPRRGSDSLPVVPHQTAAQFPRVDTSDPKRPVLLQQFGDPAQKRGLIQRPMPLDIAEPLAVTLPPRASIDLPLDVTERGGLVVDGAEAGIEVRLDREVFPQGGQVWPMGHDLRLINRTNAPQQVVARLVPPERGLPALPSEALQALPDFAEIRDGEALPMDLAGGQQETLTVRVDAPALYEVVSEGLLAVEGTLRTRTTTRLDQQSRNGPGRNFLLQQYLREGEYQVTAQTLGQSAGHLRVRLRQTTLHDGGTLAPERPARVALEAGDGVVYQLQVPESGRWQIRSSAEGQIPRCRLEDADGWPMIAPNQPADLELDLAAGSYRLVLLPSAVDERRVTTMAPVRPAVSPEGHGPHPLALDAPTPHRWLEPRDGGDRLPDLWTFSLAAPATVSVDLSEGMTGQLFRDNTLLDDLGGRLPAGEYQLSVRSLRPDHGRPYTLAVHTEELTAGRSRACTAPCTVPVSAAGLLELSTVGDADVRLRLFAGDRLIADSDDRPGGWNALLLEDLPADRYTLRVSPVGTSQASTTVVARQPEIVASPPVSVGDTVTLEPGDAVLEMPISAPRQGVLLAEVRAPETVGVAIVQGGQVLASGSGEVARAGAWLDPDQPARLRVWSADRRGAAVSVSVAHTAPTPLRPGALRASVQAGQAPIALATQRGGAFQVDAPGAVVACTAPGQPCAPIDRLTATRASALVLIAQAPEGTEQVTLSVAEDILSPGRWSRLTAPQGGVRWAAERGRGPVLVLARTNRGQPGVRIVDAASTAETSAPMVVPAAGERLAVAARASLEAPTVELWPASGEAALPMRAQVWRFAAPRSERAAVGSADVSVPAGEAVRRTIARTGPVTVTLPAGTAAILVEDGAPQVYYAESDALTVESGRAESVTLLNPTAAGGLARLVVHPGAPETWTLTASAPVEDTFARRHVRRLWVPAREGAGWTVQTAGAVGALRWLGEDGRVRLGDGSLSIGTAGGWLELEALPGAAVVWLSGDGASGLTATAAAQEVALPARIAASGTEATLAVRGAAGDVLQVHTAAPAVVSIQTPAGAQAARVLVHGGAVALPMAGGAATVSVRALAGGSLHGTLDLQAITPAALVDGVGEPLALAPGEHRWLSFEIGAEQEIGVGVQSGSDRVAVSLVDAAGALVGTGRVQLHTLPAGRYLLGLSLPADAAPATAQPALVGRTPRGDGPPDDIIRQYVEERR